MSGSEPRTEHHNPEAEQAVLAVILTTQDGIDLALEHVSPDEFFTESHRLVYRAAVELAMENTRPDVITVTDRLDRDGHLRLVDELWLRDLTYAVVPAEGENLAPHAQIVREAARKRAMVAASVALNKSVWSGATADEIAEEFEKQTTEVSGIVHLAETTKLSANLDKIYATIKAADEAGGPITGLSSGFPDIDAITGGFFPGQLIVLGARPSFGKSTLAQNIADNVADSGKPIIFFSLEMSPTEILCRSLARRAGVPVAGLLNGWLQPEQKARIKDGAIDAITARPFFIEPAMNVSPAMLRAKARRIERHAGSKLGLIVVDYLQLMTSSGNEESRQQEMAAISRSLKMLAVDLEVPVLAVSQLSRALESRQNKRPMLSDLRDSGAIEQDANIVMFLYHDFAYSPDVPLAEQNTYEVIVAKNRMGVTGTKKLTLIGSKASFQNYTGGLKVAASDEEDAEAVA